MLPAFRKYWHADRDDLQLLLDRSDPERESRVRIAMAGVLAYHVSVVAIALFFLSGRTHLRELSSQPIDLSRATPLVVPRFPKELTQRDPNKGKVATEFNLESLLPKPPLVAPSSPQPGRPQPKAFSAPAESAAAPKTIEAPRIDVAQVQLPQAAPPPGVQIEPQEKPKIAFERVGAPQGIANGSGAAKQPVLAPPKSSVDDAVRGVARSGHGLVVGDAEQGAANEIFHQTPSPGRNGSSLELLSDPQGVDFRPYLVQILAAVRRNWMAILPESTRFGRSGRVAVQFSISKDGRVPKLVIAVPSGAEALDRAAVAGVSASNPFPPLPPEFRGDQIRLQFVFSYNMASR
jgi:TonB family protein